MNYLNGPTAGVAIGQSSGSTGSQKELLEIIQMALRCWWKIATPIGLLLAMAAMGAMLKFVKPRYTAAAWIEIREKPETMLTSHSSEDARKYVQNQLELLRSPLIIDRVTANPQVSTTPELVDKRDPSQTLRTMLNIRPMGGSDYFIIQFTSLAPEKAALVANEVATAYLDIQDRNDSQRNQKIIDLLKQQQANQQQVVQTHRDNVRVLSLDRTGRDPFAVDDSKGRVQLRNPLADVQSQLTTHEAEQIQLQAEIESLEELIATESFEPSPEDVHRLVSQDPRVMALQDLLRANRVKIEGYHLTGKNPETIAGYPQLKRETAEAEEALRKARADRESEFTAQLKELGKKSREQQLSKLKTDANGLALKVQYLQKRLEGQFENRKKFEGDTLELEFKRADYDRASRIHELISTRILNLEYEQYAQSIMGRVKLFKKADVPAAPDQALPFKHMGLAGMVAFLLPFSLAIGVEYLFRRVSSRDQLEQAHAIPVVGEITSLPRRRRLSTESKHRSRDIQLFEESIDALRTYLALVDSFRDQKVIAVTSAITQEGKTNLAAQLALSIAGATGEPVLLIDGDMRSPDMDRIFGVERNPGLAELLAGECTVDDAIETQFDSNLHILPAGTLSMSPHRLLGNGEFAALLDQVRDRYRRIIIDTAPLLPASESLVVARAADAAIVCVRRDYSRLDQVVDACSRLRAAGVKVAGAVINGIPMRSYAYKYGRYDYGSRRAPVDSERRLRSSV